MDIGPLAGWVRERHSVYVIKTLREGGTPFVPPETDLSDFQWMAHTAHYPLSRDPIFCQYRFCNVFRELDRVTAWVRYHIRRKFAEHEDLWLMLAIVRTINWPDTLQHLLNTNGMPNETDWPWKPEDMTSELEIWQERGNKVYTGAYMIRAESNPKAPWYSWSKNRYISEVVIGRLWEDRKKWHKLLALGDDLCMERVWNEFQDKRYIGWGPFMAYQVVVDMRHTRYLRTAPDINTWTALGPGSRRGLNRLAGRPLDYPLKQAEGLKEMVEIWKAQDEWRPSFVPPIELSDVQNCLCEVDKYLRVKNGEGRPRAMYVPGRGY